MQRRDKNISAQLELSFYATDLLGAVVPYLRIRQPRGPEWLGWLGSPLAIGSPRLPTAGPYIYSIIYLLQLKRTKRGHFLARQSNFVLSLYPCDPVYAGFHRFPLRPHAPPGRWPHRRPSILLGSSRLGPNTPPQPRLPPPRCPRPFPQTPAPDPIPSRIDGHGNEDR